MKSFRFNWLLAAAALSLTLQAVIALRAPIIAVDGVRFVEMARALDDSPRQALRAFNQHPGYPAMLLAAAKTLEYVTGHTGNATLLLAGQVVSAVFGLLSVVMVWLLARRLFDDKTANIAAMVFACVPLIRQNAADMLSDSPHLTFYLLAAWCVAGGFHSGRVGWFLAGGTASGIAYWIRPEGLSVALVAGTLAVLWIAGRSGFGRVRRFACLASLLAAAAIVVAPYAVLAGKITSKKQPLAAQQNPSFHQLPFVNDAATSTPVSGTQTAAADIGADGPRAAAAGEDTPRTWTGRISGALVKYVAEILYGFRYLLLIPLFCGWFAARWRMPDRPSLVIVVSLAVFHSALLLWLYDAAGYIGHRHVIPLIALGAPFVGCGIAFLAEASVRLAGDRRWYSAAQIGGIAVVALVLVPRCVRPLNHAHRTVVEVAAWIKQHGNATGAVLTNSPFIRFYAEREADVLGVSVSDLENALSPSSGSPRYELVVLEVDARSYDPPESCLLACGYERVYRGDGGDRKSWQQFYVYRLKPDDMEKLSTAVSTERGPRELSR